MKLMQTAFTTLMAIQIASCSQVPQNRGSGTVSGSPLRLWYEYPAEEWMTQALPIGNGTLGAMFFGGIQQEHIQFNEKTVWSGNSADRGGYQNFGDIYIDFASHGADAKNYLRELSISDAIGSVSYDIKGVSYRREYFASFPDGLVAMRFTVPKGEGKLSFSVDLADAHSGGLKTAERNTIRMRGRLALVSYEARLVVLNEGGTVAPDGGRKLIIDGADAVTILLAGGTNYDIASSAYIGYSQAELSERLQAVTECASQKTYAELKNRHIADYRVLFSRVTLELNQGEPPFSTGELVRFHADSNYLDMLYFQYGRYLMISSSRGMSLPNNLQGIWNNNNYVPWGSDIHSNINVQMNYWPAEVTNLSECHLPFLNYIATEAMRPGGFWRNMAAGMGHRGWVLTVENNIFGHSRWSQNNPCNAWYSSHLWQHYAYTLDEAFLRDTAWPVMKSACEFWFDRLIEAPDGTLEAPNEFVHEQGSENAPNSEQDGLPYTQQLIWDLFHKTLKASGILGIDDPAFTAELQDKFNRLDSGLHIGSWGNIMEWKYGHDQDYKGNTHRHLSHLMALYPLDQITAYAAAEFTDAAVESLNSRGDLGPGWSRTWRLVCWARLKDGNRAHSLLKKALIYETITTVRMTAPGSVYENLLCAHPPFQIDGNFGAAAGIAEMLIQSHKGYIELLPALPDAWNNGSFTGLKAQGNFTVDLEWRNSKPVLCTVYSGSGGECTVRYGTGEVTLQTAPGGKYTVSL